MARLNASLALMRNRLVEMSAAEEESLQAELAEQARELRDRTERFTRVILETSEQQGGDDLQRELNRDAQAKGLPTPGSAKAPVPLRNRAQPTPPPPKPQAAPKPTPKPTPATPGADAQPRRQAGPEARARRRPPPGPLEPRQAVTPALTRHPPEPGAGPGHAPYQHAPRRPRQPFLKGPGPFIFAAGVLEGVEVAVDGLRARCGRCRAPGGWRRRRSGTRGLRQFRPRRRQRRAGRWRSARRPGPAPGATSANSSPPMRARQSPARTTRARARPRAGRGRRSVAKRVVDLT